MVSLNKKISVKKDCNSADWDNFVDSYTQGTIFCKTYFLNSLNHDFEEGYKFIGFNGANSPKLEDIKHSLLGEEKLFFNITWQSYLL